MALRLHTPPPALMSPRGLSQGLAAAPPPGLQAAPLHSPPAPDIAVEPLPVAMTMSMTGRQAAKDVCV